MSSTDLSSKMGSLSTWAQAVNPSPTLAADARAKALMAAGRDVCGFGAGEPDFDTPAFIKEAAARALRDGQTKYAPAAGIPALRKALAGKYCDENGVSWAESAHVIVSPGGKFSCYLSLLAICSPGDEVVIPAPYWVSYPEMVKLTGARPVIVPTDSAADFKLTPQSLEAALTPRTRCLILNSPGNPTGTVYSQAEIETLAEVCFRKKIYLLSDEIYEHLIYGRTPHFSPASMGQEGAQWVLTVSGFSKSFSMTGWRLGTLLAPPHVAAAVADLQSQTTSNATTFAQFGALAALTEKDAAAAAIAEMKKVFDRRRRRLLEGLRTIPGIECREAEGAFYLFPSIKALGLDTDTFTARLLEEEEVAVVSGEGFGAPGHIRLSYAVSDEVIDKGLERMQRFGQKLANQGGA